MYYPYLRGKQFELKALRDYSSENLNEEQILPIIEPVNQSTNALSLAIDQLKANGMKFSIIMNPNDGDFKHKTVSFDILTSKPDLVKTEDVWIPAYLYQGRALELDREITKSTWNEVILVFKTCADVDNPDVSKLISNAKVKTIVNNFGKTISRRVKKTIKDTGKSLVAWKIVSSIERGTPTIKALWMSHSLKCFITGRKKTLTALETTRLCQVNMRKAVCCHMP